jgi:hypothetical protein
MATQGPFDGLTHADRLSKAFTPHRPIDLPEFLSGRLPLLYRAMDAVNTEGLHLVLFGDRGTGKTSIARVLAYNVQEPERQDGRRAILVSCTSSDDFASIWRKVVQEILVAQRQLGFVQDATASVIGRLDAEDAPLDNPNDIRLFVKSLPNPSVIVIDEFDRLPPGHETTRLMADTIKLFADTNARSSLVVVGVAESLGDLIAEHESIARNIAQLYVELMTLEELEEIVQKGFGRSGLDFEKGVDRLIARWSQGYPHYTHLLGLWSGRRALGTGRLTVTENDVREAVEDALRNAAGGVQQEYERAISTGRGGTLFKEVLLACALAEKDSLGRFSAVSVRAPLNEILPGSDYNTGAFQSHLAKFCEPARGPVLKRTGSRRNYRWQFVNPQLIPYIRLCGVKSGMITD